MARIQADGDCDNFVSSAIYHVEQILLTAGLLFDLLRHDAGCGFE